MTRSTWLGAPSRPSTAWAWNTRPPRRWRIRPWPRRGRARSSRPSNGCGGRGRSSAGRETGPGPPWWISTWPRSSSPPRAWRRRSVIARPPTRVSATPECPREPCNAWSCARGWRSAWETSKRPGGTAPRRSSWRGRPAGRCSSSTPCLPAGRPKRRAAMRPRRSPPIGAPMKPSRDCAASCRPTSSRSPSPTTSRRSTKAWSRSRWPAASPGRRSKRRSATSKRPSPAASRTCSPWVHRARVRSPRRPTRWSASCASCVRSSTGTTGRSPPRSSGAASPASAA